MNNHKRVIFSIVIPLFFLTVLPLYTLDSHLMDIRIKGIDRAGPPEYLEQQVLLSYESNEPVRLVGARFAHEDYRIFHVYFRNENGVFLLLLDIPEEVGALHYRIVVDGLWISDPFNPQQQEDVFGRGISVFQLQDRPPRPAVSPEIREGKVTFLFQSLPNRAVSVAGDFNNWDPFWHRMQETKPGEYRLTVQMPPGRHFYYFVVNGDRVLDPINQDSARDYEGYRVSAFFIPRPDSR